MAGLVGGKTGALNPQAKQTESLAEEAQIGEGGEGT